MASVSSSSSTSTQTHLSCDAYISFNETDVGPTFVSHLCKALEKKEITTFKDDRSLKKGKSIPEEHLKAIEESKFAIIIFSENYASFTACLDGLVKIMKCRGVESLKFVLPVFYKVKPSEVRKQIENFALADREAESDGCIGRERVQVWREALFKAANLSGWEVTQHGVGSVVVRTLIYSGVMLCLWFTELLAKEGRVPLIFGVMLCMALCCVVICDGDTEI